MAQWALDPQPTRSDMKRVANLVAKAIEARGLRHLSDAASAIGIHYSELSRLLSREGARPWGYSRLARVASWLGVTLDQLLGRKEGTTKILTAGGRVMAPPPLPLTERAAVMRLAEQIADTKISAARVLEKVLHEAVGDKLPEATFQHLIDNILFAVDLYAKRLAVLYESGGQAVLGATSELDDATEAAKRQVRSIVAAELEGKIREEIHKERRVSKGGVAAKKPG